MRKEMAFVPALGAFGPLLIVIGMDSPHHWISFLGAFATMGAMLILFVSLSRLIQSQHAIGGAASLDSDAMSGVGRRTMLAMAAAAVLLIAVLGFLLARSGAG